MEEAEKGGGLHDGGVGVRGGRRPMINWVVGEVWQRKRGIENSMHSQSMWAS